MRIAVIPARGGSKRIPRKNLKNFCGKQSISYSIALGLNSGLFDRVFVSSDDEEILSTSRSLGADTIVRPSSLSDDLTGTLPVMKHALFYIEETIQEIESLCCIYPVTPLLTMSWLEKGYEKLRLNEDKFVFPVCRLQTPPSRAFWMKSDGHIELQSLDASNSRTQDLRPGYIDAGQFYWGMRDSWINFENIHQHGCGIDSGKWEFIDIDEPEDWEMAELIYSGRIKNRNSGS